jgi:acylphosphatase
MALAKVDPSLDTFTIIDWTSTTRNITNPYTLVFKLRDRDKVISTADAKDVWHGILKSTLKGDDLKKLIADD